MAKTDFVKFITPEVEAQYAVVHEPRDNYDKNGQEFRIVGVFENAEAAKPLAAKLKAAADKALAAAIADAPDKKTENKLSKLEYNDPIKPEEDEDGEPTGRVLVRFKRNALTKAGKPNRVDVFDAKRNPVSKSVLIGNGSVVRIAVSAYGYQAAGLGHYGLSFMLDAVKVNKLVEYTANGPREAKDYGFEDEDGDVIDSDSSDFEEEGGDGSDY